MYQLARNSLVSAIRLWKSAKIELDQVIAQIPNPGSPPAILVLGGLLQNISPLIQQDGPGLGGGEIGSLSETLKELSVPSTPSNLNQLLDTVANALNSSRNTLLNEYPNPDASHTAQGAIYTEMLGIESTLDQHGPTFPLGLVNNVRALLDTLNDVGTQLLQRIEEILEVSSLVGERHSIRGIRGAMEDLGAYPVLTSELGPTGYGGGGPSAIAPGSNFARQVDSALRDILGRTPRRADSRSFVSALNQSFEVREFEGRTEVTWRPHSLVGQADLSGGITGAQASVYASAALGLQNSLDLLDELEPLDTEADAQECEALQAIVRSELTQIVSELKIEGGPRVARVDRLFQQLLGKDSLANDGGHLRNLRAEFGFEDRLVNTLDEELNLSNFIALRDYAIGIRRSWDTFKNSSLGKDLGTRLVLLSRVLTVVAESVNEVIAAMDSVFVGPSERQVVTFVDEQQNPIILDELLSWITTFSTEEAPSLVQDAGRLGANAIIDEAEQLSELVRYLITLITIETNLPSGLRHSRVLRPLSELAGYLEQVRKIADDVSQPLKRI